MNVVHVALSQRLLCGIVICSSVVSCVHVCFRIGCLYMCVETVDNACAIADTLLNGVRARLCGHSMAVSVRLTNVSLT